MTVRLFLTGLADLQFCFTRHAVCFMGLSDLHQQGSRKAFRVAGFEQPTGQLIVHKVKAAVDCRSDDRSTSGLGFQYHIRQTFPAR